MYSTARSRPSRSFSTRHSHLQSAKTLCLPQTAPAFIGEKKGGCTAALLPAADFRRQSTEAANLPLPRLAQRRFSGQGRGELRSEAALGAQLKQLGKAELYDLTRFALIYFSSSEKAVFNFANKSYRLWLWSLLQLCSVQRRVSLHQKRWQAARCWESCRRAALVPYLQLCLLRLHPQGRLPRGKSGFPGGRWSVSIQHSQDEALRMLTQAFQSDRRAAVCHSCLSSTAHHSFTIPSGHKTELPNSQVTQHWKQWLFLRPAIQKYSVQDKMVICKIH